MSSDPSRKEAQTISQAGIAVHEASDLSVSVPPGPTEPVQVGDRVAGKYRVERTLGSSGMGIVYLAQHEEIGQWVAIKFLLEAAKNPQALARFKREARVMAKIKNKHAVRIVDVGQLDEDTPYIVMDYLEGRDLSALMKGGPLPIPMACDIALQVCEALASAHAAGVVHRDLKPSNIFLTPQTDGSSHVTVIDFGVAKLRTAKDEGKKEDVTHTAMLIGSPRYMSPEQVSASRDVDHRSDVWALGVLFQEMLTGQRVFNGDGVGMILAAIASMPATPIERILPAAPEPIVQLMRDVLEKDPAKRVPDVAAFASYIAGFLPDGEVRLGRIRSTLGQGSPDSISGSGTRPVGSSGSWSGATPLALGSSPSVVTGASLAEPATEKKSNKLPVPLLLALAFFIAAGAGAAAFVVKGRGQAPPEKVTTSAAPQPSAAPAGSTPAANSAESEAIELPEASSQPTGRVAVQAPVRPVASQPSARASASAQVAPPTPDPTTDKPPEKKPKRKDFFDDPR